MYCPQYHVILAKVLFLFLFFKTKLAFYNKVLPPNKNIQ